jgi:cytochrome b pre-mRNA-processing protein 3
MACVAVARQEHLYTDLGVPDTREGRFEMLVIAVYTAIRKTRTDNPGLAQDLMDSLIDELEGTLREDSFADKGLKKRMKHLVATVYERFGRYEAALNANDQAQLAKDLAEVVWGQGSVTPAADALRQTLFIPQIATA